MSYTTKGSSIPKEGIYVYDKGTQGCIQCGNNEFLQKGNKKSCMVCGAYVFERKVGRVYCFDSVPSTIWRFKEMQPFPEEPNKVKKIGKENVKRIKEILNLK